MTSEDKINGDEIHPWLLQLIEDALRSCGEAFPLTDQQIDEFMRRVKPKPIDKSFVERVTLFVTKGKPIRSEAPMPALALPLQDDPELREIASEVLALARKGKPLSESVKKKLEEHRDSLLRKLKKDPKNAGE